LRTVIHEHRFDLELEELVAKVPRVEDFVFGAEWVLARNPFTGTQVRLGSPTWFLPDLEGALSVECVIYYTFDEDTVWLLSIQTTGFHTVDDWWREPRQ
jgi:hypothetical protein